MSASLSAPTPVKGLVPASVPVAGHTASTAYVAVIGQPSGASRLYYFTTDGSGAATIPVVPQESGKYTVTTYLATQPVVASTTFNAGGV